jgi:hypothetical protein
MHSSLSRCCHLITIHLRCRLFRWTRTATRTRSAPRSRTVSFAPRTLVVLFHCDQAALGVSRRHRRGAGHEIGEGRWMSMWRVQGSSEWEYETDSEQEDARQLVKPVPPPPSSPPPLPWAWRRGPAGPLRARARHPRRGVPGRVTRLHTGCTPGPAVRVTRMRPGECDAGGGLERGMNRQRVVYVCVGRGLERGLRRQRVACMCVREGRGLERGLRRQRVACVCVWGGRGLERGLRRQRVAACGRGMGAGDWHGGDWDGGSVGALNW